MAITSFIGDEDRDKIISMEWLRTVKENCKDHFQEIFMLNGENYKWWRSLDKYTSL